MDAGLRGGALGVGLGGAADGRGDGGGWSRAGGQKRLSSGNDLIPLVVELYQRYTAAGLDSREVVYDQSETKKFTIMWSMQRALVGYTFPASRRPREL
jgi:hypothetical protein